MRQVRRNRAVTGVALGALALLLSTGCSSDDPVVQKEEVAEQASAILEEQVGQAYGVTVTTTSVDGENAEFDVQVDDEPKE